MLDHAFSSTSLYVVPHDCIILFVLLLGLRWRKKQEFSRRSDLKVLRTVKQHVLKLPLQMRAHSLQVRMV